MQTGLGWPAVLAGVIGLPVGALAGWGVGVLLGFLRRGVILRPGVIAVAAAAVTGLGAGLAWPSSTTAMVIWAGLLGIALGAVDIAAHRLPDALTLPAIPITVIVLLVTEYAFPATGTLGPALLTAIVLTAAFAAVAALAPRAMGWGDVKLVPSLALLTGYLSITTAVLAVAIAFVLGALVAVIGLLLRRLTLTSSIPFGPFLLAGCWLVLALPGLVTGIG